MTDKIKHFKNLYLFLKVQLNNTPNCLSHMLLVNVSPNSKYLLEKAPKRSSKSRHYA